MNRILSFYIQDALDAIKKIETFIEGQSLESFETNELVKDAVIRNFEVIGETVKRIPDDIRNEFPGIPWKSMVGLRNTLLHDYLGIDNSILYKIATDDIKKTKIEFQKCLKFLKDKEG